ncbi:MAG: glycogen/starch synthase, partial [Bacteroidales bacterium]|nr:glycogen/starch synthase [Bacteroidales bacterium]
MEKHIKPDFIFETSWEVCNKVGGIHTVLSTKALTLVNDLKKNYILIGPDVWRDTQNNPEFEEDHFLFRSWSAQAAEEGLRVRVGRWKIQGSPVALIVDFQSYTLQKDAIFATFWESYKLDSLTGQWDYVEPALFGYAAAKVIESFVRYYAGSRDRIIAQFHEWMTGTGLLYLKLHVPQVATVFTTHATVLGRSVAGNLLPLYGNMQQYNPELKAAEFNLKAKQSLEQLSAFHSDAFTTVSAITARECEHFLSKKVDVITPNGFEDSFVPSAENFNPARQKAREKLMQVSKALFGSISENPCFIATSGRYEFKNKGVDVFIKTLGALNRDPELSKEVIALLLIPANHYGPRKDLQAVLSGQGINENGKILTHNLHDQEYDPILNLICHENLGNAPENKVKIMFVPCYLNGTD